MLLPGRFQGRAQQPLYRRHAGSPGARLAFERLQRVAGEEPWRRGGERVGAGQDLDRDRAPTGISSVRSSRRRSLSESRERVSCRVAVGEGAAWNSAARSTSSHTAPWSLRWRLPRLKESYTERDFILRSVRWGPTSGEECTPYRITSSLHLRISARGFDPAMLERVVAKKRDRRPLTKATSAPTSLIEIWNTANASHTRSA